MKKILSIRLALLVALCMPSISVVSMDFDKDDEELSSFASTEEFNEDARDSSDEERMAEAQAEQELFEDQPSDEALRIFAQKHGLYALHHAASQPCHAAILKGLLNRLEGFQVDERNDAGETPLHTAANHSNLTAVCILLILGASRRARGPRRYAAIHYAAAHGDIGIIRALLERNRPSQVRFRTANGNHARDLALAHGHAAAAQLL